jgi:hypothetical protein
MVAEALRDYILSSPYQVIPSSDLAKFYAIFPESEALIKVYGGLKKFVQSYSNYLVYDLDPNNPKRGTLQIRAANAKSSTSQSSPFKYSFTVPANAGTMNAYGLAEYNMYGSTSIDSTLESSSSGRSTLFSSASSSSRDHSEKGNFHIIIIYYFS